MGSQHPAIPYGIEKQYIPHADVDLHEEKNDMEGCMQVAVLNGSHLYEFQVA